MEKPIIEQQALVPRDVVIVNGVQDPGLTPLKEFLPRSAPKIGSSTVSQVSQIPAITHRTLSVLKAQIRIEQGRARELQAKAAEKEEESERSQCEERRLGSQADDLAEALVKMEWQETRLERKIASLEQNLDDHLLMVSSVVESIEMYKASYMRHQGQVTRLMHDAENKTREAERFRGMACNSVVMGIDHRTHGNKSQANSILRQVERWLQESDQLDLEVKEHSNRHEEWNREIQRAECLAVQHADCKRDLERDIIGFQYQLYNSQRQLEEIKRDFKGNWKLFLQLRDEVEWVGMISVSESDEADEARKQAEVAELQAQRTRKEVEQVLGKCVNHGAGLDEMLEQELEKPASVGPSAPGRSRKEKGTRKRSERMQSVAKT